MISKAAIPNFHALLVRDLQEPYFDPHWHFHPEYQLFTVLEGTGTRFIGNHMQRFGPGDLVLTGPNLRPRQAQRPCLLRQGQRSHDPRHRRLFPRGHPWRAAARDAGEHENQAASASVAPGDRIPREGTSARREGYRCSAGKSGFVSVLALLQILHALSLSDEYTVLSRLGLPTPLRPVDQERMEKVYAYLMGNFTYPLRLEEVAAIANITPTAFCRYFKERTNKSLSQFLASFAPASRVS